jgi:hypothetical protein
MHAVHDPELSPAERLWLHLRQHDWSNRVYPAEVRISGAR